MRATPRQIVADDWRSTLSTHESVKMDGISSRWGRALQGGSFPRDGRQNHRCLGEARRSNDTTDDRLIEYLRIRLVPGARGARDRPAAGDSMAGRGRQVDVGWVGIDSMAWRVRVCERAICL
jgi:hypothetical protein